MPRDYRKKYRKYKKYKKYARQSHQWGKYGYANMAKTALKTAQWVAGLVNVEKKFFDTQILNQALDSTAYSIYPLNLIAQGDDENMRNGRSILAKQLIIRGTLSLSSAADVQSCRFVLVRDKANPGANVNMSDIYKTITGATAVNSFRNLLTGAAQRYDILWDKRITLDKDTKGQLTLEKYFRLNNHIHFIGTTGNTADLGNGSYFLCMISDGTVSSDRYMIFNGETRIRYIDN